MRQRQRFLYKLLSNYHWGELMGIVLDELDKRILHELCTGIYSYDQLAHACNVTRNTIYRRVGRLEKAHAISKRVMAIPDFQKLGLSAICIGINVAYEHLEDVISIIKQQVDTKFLWRTYGIHQCVFVMACEKGCEGAAIAKLRQALVKFQIAEMHVSIGFIWEKMDFTPY
jgi:DNA-binding Lrp family transcriptional regulator